MSKLFYSVKPRLPLWAELQRADDHRLAWRWAFIAAIMIVSGAIFAIAQIDFSIRPEAVEKPVLQVVLVAQQPEPKKEEPKHQQEEQKQLPPPKKIKRSEQAPPKTPLNIPEPAPEVAPIAKAPPSESISERAVNIPPPINPPTSQSPPGSPNEIRRKIASLVPCDPDYPNNARQRGITGEFMVHMSVDSSGTVTEVQIISGNPRAIFERNIKRSMSRCKFEPTSAGFIAEAPIIFKLEN